MIYFLIPIIVILMTIASVKGKNALEYRRVYGLVAAKDLSWPAKQVLARYNALPASSRPAINMYEVVKALDVKHGGSDAVTEKYKSTNYHGKGEVSYSWTAPHYRSDYLTDYKDMFDAMGVVAQALADREKELALFRISHQLGEAQTFAQQMKEEADNIYAGTKEMTRDPLELR